VLATSVQDEVLAILLADLALIAVCALALGALARRVGQPVVLGEILAGLMLGPSLLGLLPGDLPGFLFPADVRPFLSVIAQLALVLFMFGVGFEVDLGQMRRLRGDTMRTAGAAILVPAVAALGLAPALMAGHPPPAGDGVSVVHFTAFVAIALSVTAFPVLARMLAEASYGRERLGTLALLVAAATDLAAWVALAVVTATLGRGGGGSQLVFAAELVLFFASLALARPLLRAGLRARWCASNGPAGAALLLLFALALAAAATTALGLHPVFGAFALGVACPRDDLPAVGRELRAPIGAAARLLSSAGLILVPTYFISTGLNVDVRTIGGDGALELLIVLVVATASKVGAAMWAARRCLDQRGEPLALGLLLNTRGLTEIVVLDVGRTAGIIDGRLFTVLVLFALITTAATTPLVPAALNGRLRRRGRTVPAAPAPAERALR
jgi:Kef-type K+ transport system membrane component KefB